MLYETLCKSAGVANNLFGVDFECGLGNLEKGSGDTSNCLQDIIYELVAVIWMMEEHTLLWGPP